MSLDLPEDPLVSDSFAGDAFARQLSRFTPNGSGLDRDALLFAAGKASAKPNRRWLALAGALAASQLLTVAVFLWLGHASPVPVPFKAPPAMVAVEPPLPPAPEVPGRWTLRELIFATEDNLPAPTPAELVPSPPPLKAFGELPPELLH